MGISEEAVRFYAAKYDLLQQWMLRPGEKFVLGDAQNRVCRFCARRPPEVTFRKVAHAIPEALGNKSIESTYECDECNEGFGKGIENDLGNWSKPMRTFARIRGKNGVPTLKKGGDGGWRIEYGSDGFNIKSYEADPVHELDVTQRRITFHLKRDSYTPVAVLKAFLKIGLTLIPDEEVENFKDVMAWVRCSDHSRPFADQLPLIYTFQPGPMPNDLIAVFLLRRREGVEDVPYLYLVIGYGNEVFQIALPSEIHDRSLNGKTLEIIPFPAPGASSDPALYGPNRVRVLNLTGRDVVKGEQVPLQLGFNAIKMSGPEPSAADGS